MRLVEASPAHIPFLAQNMRVDDVTECAAFGRSPSDALRHGLAASLWALTALVDGEPHAMMGVASRNMLEGVGVPWMLGTDKVYSHRRDLAQHSAAIIGEMQANFDTLENLVSAQNHRALRYLRHMGFEICQEVRMVGGTAFVLFRKDA